MKKIVWLAIAFAFYAGWCHFPAYMKHNQLEGSIQSGLDHAESQVILDSAIIQKTLKTARDLEIPIEEGDIYIRHESRTGERSIHVEFAMPIEIEFLGKKKTVVRQVAASRTFAVDEVQLAQQAQQRTRFDRAQEEQTKRLRAETAAYKARLDEECSSKGDLITTHLVVTRADGRQQFIDCGSLDHW